MRRKIMTGIMIMLIFAGIAYSDFGSFSGNSDYGSSRSSSTSTRSTSSGGGWGGSWSTSTTRTGFAPEYGVAGGITGITLDDGGGELAGVGFVLLVFFVFWLMIHINSKKRKSQPTIGLQGTVKVLRPMSEYLQVDPGFDEERIRALMANLYVQMQETWQKKDISSLRPYMTDKFFTQMDNQLEEFRRLGRTDYTERIAVLNTGLVGWRQSSGMDYVTVSLASRIVSYVLDDRSGELISGDRKREKFMEYEIELCRKSGIVTRPEDDRIKSERCPHCGAPLRLNASAKCEYCGSVVTAVNAEWAVCGMRGISQRTA